MKPSPWLRAGYLTVSTFLYLRWSFSLLRSLLKIAAFTASPSVPLLLLVRVPVLAILLFLTDGACRCVLEKFLDGLLLLTNS